MSTNSNNRGRAYEYAWIKILYEALYKLRQTKITKNSSLAANERAWSAVSPDMQDLFLISASAAIDTLLELEPRMTEVDKDVLLLEAQVDERGVEGDVRDVVIRRDDIDWEIGLSIKHNHEAVKHSRLSYRLDFGNEWFGIPCSKKYWDAVTPIFDRLKAEKANGARWSELEDKEKAVYMPLLQAFMKEVQETYSIDSSIPWKMVEYLIGVKDYYKIVSMDNKRLTIIYSFNIHNTLNKPSRMEVSAISVPVVELPTDLVTIRFKPNSRNTVEIYLNNGWQLSFRIHNASTKVEPSLKFDIQFIGMPVSILNIECKWKKE
ncbi:HaeIII family restriction endonuclease [Lancefieldella rimae]|uniref:HaeIII family restriction endonuclease n=1 Tax=Lancefieldella rimae TaxID=1383 RepID=UPI00288B2969|nr:HaeIII family restriction endonuclease [Lancefieldella rimae]